MSDRIHAATRKGLFTIERREGDGREWRIARRAFLGTPISMVLDDPRDGRLYAAAAHGHFGVKFHRSADRGETWRECAAPAYPAMPESAGEGGKGAESPDSWTLHQIWSLEAGGDGEDGVLWAGTIPGGLFRSPDGGDSWELVRSLWDMPERREWFGGGYDHPGIHSICVDPTDARRVLVAVSCGGAWETTDGGDSWRNRSRGMWAAYLPPERKDDPNLQDPHRVVRCGAAPRVLWAAHHNGVFRTTDGGERWEEVKDVPPSVFGFAAAVHPQDPDTAWFVPAVKDDCRIPVGGRVVVARTRDGGRSFDVLGDGLPQEDAYDLVYRHGLDVDPSGRRLVLGSTTGSIWVSEDQGDTWRAVGHHLPPVFAVRFAS